MFNGMVSLANLLSKGSLVIEIGFYTLVGILVIVYFIIPLVKMFSIPSERLFTKMHEGSRAATQTIYRMSRRNKDFEFEHTREPEKMKKQITEYYSAKANGFNKIVLETAFKITTTVTVSPNSFIDGLVIILGNSRMVYRLMKHLGIRYSIKGLFTIYYNIFAVASITGIMQEYNEEIEEFLIDMANAITKESSKSIPILNIVFSAASPLLQASLNYAFIIYSGMRIKYRMLKTIQNNSDTDKDISLKARREARKERLKYFQKTLAKIKEKIRNSKKKKPDDEGLFAEV
jgi:hypothetical protein